MLVKMFLYGGDIIILASWEKHFIRVCKNLSQYPHILHSSVVEPLDFDVALARGGAASLKNGLEVAPAKYGGSGSTTL